MYGPEQYCTGLAVYYCTESTSELESGRLYIPLKTTVSVLINNGPLISVGLPWLHTQRNATCMYIFSVKQIIHAFT